MIFSFLVNYSCIFLDIHLKRNHGYYITQIYVPSALVVVLSWVNFWLTVDAVPARISLGLLTVLTTTTQSTSFFSNLQKVSYVKALDVWLAVCMLFVFAALLEFAYVNVTYRVTNRRKSIQDLPMFIHKNGDQTRFESIFFSEKEEGVSICLVYFIFLLTFLFWIFHSRKKTSQILENRNVRSSNKDYGNILIYKHSWWLIDVLRYIVSISAI